MLASSRPPSSRVRSRRLAAVGVLLLAVSAVGALVATSRERPPRIVAAVGAPRYLARPHVPALAPLRRPREDRAVDRVLRRMPLVLHGGSRRREIALTFDDGPGPYTPAVLRVLEREHVPATFFAVGSMERFFSSGTRAELRAHDVVGDHTESHPMLRRLGPLAQREQIGAQTEWLRRLGAPFPRLFRPPYGSFDAATLAELRRRRMLMVLWSTDTEDYRRPGVARIVGAALGGARPGAIILLHDAGGDRSQTVAALPIIVRALRARRFRLVTVPRLLLDDPPRRPQPLPAGLRGGG